MRNTLSIEITGIDGSGKQTQSMLLTGYLKKNKVDAEIISFPNYEIETGKLVRKFLKGDIDIYGDDSMEKAIREGSFYAIDRMRTLADKKLPGGGKSYIEKYKEGTILVFDRYVSSNFIHRTKSMNRTDLRYYIDKMEEFEYDFLGLPKPNHVVVLLVHPELSMENIDKRGNEKDKEETLENLQLSYKSLIDLCEMMRYTVIHSDYFDKDLGKYKMRDASEIHEEILTKIGLK